MAVSTRHIPSLDGIRAVSFLLVFVSHTGLERYVPGGLGVTIFFFLSGFLITTLMRVEYERNASINFAHFWLRRALRILPPFYLVLLAAALASRYFDPSSVSAPAVAAQALHYSNYWIIFHGYDGLPEGTGVYWSLAVEEHFYVIFPWVYSTIKSLNMSARQQAFVFWGLCAAVLVWRCVLVFAFHASENRTYMASDTRLDSILLGSALAVWKNPVLDDVALCERRWKYLYAPGAALLIGVCLLVRGEGFRETVRYTIQGVALTVLFVAAIRYCHWAPFRLLNWRPMASIGVVSYSLYLLHYAVISALQHVFGDLHAPLRAALALGISLGLAGLIHVSIEKPCARLRKRLLD